MSELGTCGRFTLISRIGTGGMGEVFLAEDPAKPGQLVAIKRLSQEFASDPVFVGMLDDEARLAERLHHANIAAMLEHGMDGEHQFLVLEYVDGVSLRDLLEERGFMGLSFPLACRVIAEVAAGLDFAHRLKDESGAPLGVVHRDVSPANIMIARTGAVKIIDFGLAKARTQGVKTKPGLVKGKFGYLAPEQLSGRVDWRTDLFALGLCLYEALTGHPLFDQRTAAETVTAIRVFHGPPPIAAQVQGAPESLDALLLQSLRVDPAERHESAAAFRVGLGRVVRDSGVASVNVTDLAAIVTGLEPAPSFADLSAAEPGMKCLPIAAIALSFAALVLIIVVVAVLVLHA